ncbi:ParB/RepB/Spo0J family partition protein [Helicobacter aurati]|uniref:ParB/RepB/Spo0J family partition protein n=1 Tax=Helicobacter aurati TaxID=137778 RepID=A0A3D8J6K7_9HELI|nr:ParB/RepB/Spo0J family partition protein [Helicobacter aurati]RDU73129.1 ParB/RepB/Spo0J family partition protein [Helicobacter aurati]
MAKKKALNTGLNELLADIDGVYQGVYETIDSQKIRHVHINNIQPNPNQPRKDFDEEKINELAESIKQHGLLQPLIVTECPDASYTLIIGERRLRAAKLAGLEEVAVIVSDIEQHKLRELALIENIQRENLNPIELATCYQALISEHNITHDELSQRLCKSRSQITNTLRLLGLRKETQNLIAQNKITQGHSKILIGLGEKDEETIIQSILGQKLNVRDTEILAKKIKEKKHIAESNETGIKQDSMSSSHIEKSKLKELQKILQHYRISTRAHTNSITLIFSDNASLQNLIESLHQNSINH